MRYWLCKTEPTTFSIDTLQTEKISPWDGVRNYQARNFMRDSMQIGDKIIIYHSNTKPPGAAGIAQVASMTYPDPTQFDPKSAYYDPKATKEKPRWYLVDVAFDSKFPRYVSLPEIRVNPKFGDMLLLKKGMRLSIQPLEKTHFEILCAMGHNRQAL